MHRRNSTVELKDACNIPLAEVDPKVTEKTFLYITHSWGQYYAYRFSQSPSLGIFYPYSSVRRAAIAFTTHVGYDGLLLLVVLGNLINMAHRNWMPHFFEHVTNLLYITEMIYQSLSRGFLFGSYSYLQNPWMCFDFIATIASFSYVSNPKFRTEFNAGSLRGLRIFSIIARVPGVRTMFIGALQALSRVFCMTVIFLLFLATTALVSQKILQGSSWQKCVKVFSNDSSIPFETFITQQVNWLEDGSNDTFYTCGNASSARNCPKNYTCFPDIYLNPDTIAFDNFGHSFMNGFSLMTHEDWDNTLEEVTKSFGYLINLFFVPIVYIGAFCFLNLMLVVVVSAYNAAVNKKEENIWSYSYQHCFIFHNASKLSLHILPTDEETLNKVLKGRAEMSEHYKASKEAFHTLVDIITMRYFKKFTKSKKSFRQQVNLKSGTKGCLSLINKFRLNVKTFTETKVFQYFMLTSIIVNVIFEASDHEGISESFNKVLMIGNRVFIGIYIFEMCCLLISQGIFYFLSWWNIFDLTVIIVGLKAILMNEKGYSTILKCLRLIKQLNVQTKWSVFQRLTTIILNSIVDVLRLMILSSLSMFVFAIIGHKLLETDALLEGIELKWSFRSFAGSIFTVFRIFSGEWSDEYLTCVERSGYPLCSIVFVSYYLIGNLVIMNLFAALLISLFRVSELCNSSTETKSSSVEEEHIFQEQVNVRVQDPRSITYYIRILVESDFFKYFMYTVIVCNCIVMALHDSYVHENSRLDNALSSFTYLFTALFMLEMVLRWIGCGFRVYFSSWWQRLDFFINMISLSEVFLVHMFQFASHTGIGALRAIKSLQLAMYWRKMRTIIEALVLSIPPVLYLLPLLLLIWFPFTIFAMQKFKGKLLRCADTDNVEIVIGHPLNKDECKDAGYNFQKPFFNFDNIFCSFISMTKLALLADWDKLAILMLDKSKEMEGNNNLWGTYLFIVAFILIGGYFCSNLLIGAAVESFQEMHAYVEHGVSLNSLTEMQGKYFRALKAIGLKKPVPQITVPTNTLMKIFYKTTQTFGFRMIVFLVILSNAIAVALEWYPGNQETLRVVLRVFPVIYIVEFIIKIVGLRKYFFKDPWNVFDFFIFIACIIGVTMELVLQTSSKWLVAICLLRILRTIDLLNMGYFFQDLRIAAQVMTASFSILLHTTILFFLIIFIYSIFGMHFFNKIRPFAGINSYVNFKTFLSSAYLLFRLSTVDGWEEILNPMSQAPPYCKPKLNCGHPVFGPIYVLTFIFLTYILLANIFIVVVLESLKEADAEEKGIFKQDNLISFYNSWAKFDPHASKYISYEALSEFLNSLQTELRIPKPNPVTISYMDLPLEAGDRTHCLNILKGILKVKYGEVAETPEYRLVKIVSENKHMEVFPELKNAEIVCTTMKMKEFDRAARIIQAFSRRIRAVKKRRCSSISFRDYLKTLETGFTRPNV